MLRTFSKTTKIITGTVLGLGILGAFGSSPQPPKQIALSTSPAVNSATKQQSAPQSKVLGSKVTTKTVAETQPIPFTATTVNDATLPQGTTKVKIAGVNRVLTRTFQITDTDGVQTDKKLVSEVTTTPPVTQVTAVGTYVAPKPAPTQQIAAPTPQPQPAPTPAAASNCDPNYSGACVPNVYPSDVDCAGGSGNGPYYVQGPVTVVGTDHYGLDRDGDKIGCE